MILSEQEEYDRLRERHDALEVQIKALCSEAHRAQELETVWFCEAQLKELERMRATMRKPGEPRRK